MRETFVLDRSRCSGLMRIALRICWRSTPVSRGAGRGRPRSRTPAGLRRACRRAGRRGRAPSRHGGLRRADTRRRARLLAEPGSLAGVADERADVAIEAVPNRADHAVSIADPLYAAAPIWSGFGYLAPDDRCRCSTEGRVGKTTTSIYLSAVAASSRRTVTLIDADPQASSAEWLEQTDDESLEAVTLAEAPTDRLLAKAVARIDGDEVGVIDMPPGNERMLAKAIAGVDCVVVPTRVGGVETAGAEAVFDMVPRKVPAGLVVCSARTYTCDYQDAVSVWRGADVSVWGAVPERVTIAAGPERWLAADGLDSYRGVWRRALRAIREA